MTTPLPLLAIAALAAPASGEPQPLVFRLAPPLDEVGCPLQVAEIAMVGDVMAHEPQLRAARQADGSYRFDGVFDPIAPWLRSADLAIANLETVVAGEDLHGYTGYPTFNTPAAILDALRDAGVDVVQTANNHSLDRGELGILRTLDAIDEAGLSRAGTFRTREERARPWVTVFLPGGLEVAFLAATFATNGLPLPKGKPWMVAMTDDGELERDVARAREEADLVVVGVHWGIEYQHRPAAADVALAHRLVAAGADIVMGTHPHVLQPAEVVRVTDAVGRPREALVLYSLGNFVSDQRAAYKHGAVVARATVLRCDATDRTWVAGARFTPFWVDEGLADGAAAYRVVPTPPAGVDRCDDLDLTPADCARTLAMRAHAAEILTADALDWSLGPARPVALGFDWTGATRVGWRSFDAAPTAPADDPLAVGADD